MTDFRAEAPGGPISVRATDRFARQARATLGMVVEAEQAEGRLPEGTVVPLWWWPLELHHDASTGLRRVLAPEGVCDPRDDLTGLFALHALQLWTAQRVGVQPPGIDPEATVHLAPGALVAEAVMMERSGTPDAGSSGWYIRPDGPLTGYGDDYEPVPFVEVLAARNSLTVPMALPRGLVVRMRGDDIVSILDADKQERWT